MKKKLTYYIKKIIIHICKLDSISDMLSVAKENQKKLDEKYWSQKLNHTIEQLKYKHQLEIQEKDAQIAELESIILSLKNKEKELAKQEYFIKKQTLENFYFANKITSKIEDFALSIMSIVGEIKGIKDEAEKNKLKISATKQLLK